MKRIPRSQLGDIPRTLRPEEITDPYGVEGGGGGYSNAAVSQMNREVQQIREVQEHQARAVGPARNVAVRARFAQSAFTATDRSLQILNSSSRRMYFLLQNLGPNDVFVNFGNKAQINNVKIVVDGNYEPFVCPMDSIAVICAAGLNTTVTVIEGVEIRPGGY
jgi:hypothetical protein